MIAGSAADPRATPAIAAADGVTRGRRTGPAARPAVQWIILEEGLAAAAL